MRLGCIIALPHAGVPAIKSDFHRSVGRMIGHQYRLPLILPDGSIRMLLIPEPVFQGMECGLRGTVNRPEQSINTSSIDYIPIGNVCAHQSENGEKLVQYRLDVFSKGDVRTRIGVCCRPELLE
jgi:hypothetical protein